jgi:hypothetical protein
VLPCQTDYIQEKVKMLDDCKTISTSNGTLSTSNGKSEEVPKISSKCPDNSDIWTGLEYSSPIKTATRNSASRWCLLSYRVGNFKYFWEFS